MIFEYVGLQWTAGAVAVAWSTVGQTDSVHRDAGRVDRYPIAGDAGQALNEMRGRAVGYIEIPSLFCQREKRQLSICS